MGKAEQVSFNSSGNLETRRRRCQNYFIQPEEWLMPASTYFIIFLINFPRKQNRRHVNKEAHFIRFVLSGNIWSFMETRTPCSETPPNQFFLPFGFLLMEVRLRIPTYDASGHISLQCFPVKADECALLVQLGWPYNLLSKPGFFSKRSSDGTAGGPQGSVAFCP